MLGKGVNVLDDRTLLGSYRQRPIRSAVHLGAVLLTKIAVAQNFVAR